MHFRHFFVSLRAFMKNMFLKYASALLTVWYCMSIIGFDVHSCNTTGNIFVNSVLSGITCGDVHPEHDCSVHASCCKSNNCCDHSKADDGCCTNEIEVLDCEGVVTSDNDVCSFVSYAIESLDLNIGLSMLPVSIESPVLYYPDPWEHASPDQQAVLSIWRI